MMVFNKDPFFFVIYGFNVFFGGRGLFVIHYGFNVFCAIGDGTYEDALQFVKDKFYETVKEASNDQIEPSMYHTCATDPELLAGIWHNALRAVIFSSLRAFIGT